MVRAMTLRAPETAHDFAALALNVLLEQVAMASEDLTRLRSDLQRAPPEAPPEAPPAGAADLPRISARLERLGWLFGLLARELGSDLLFERRERDGLASSLWLVQQILARDGIELELPNLPALDSKDQRCATLCAVVARCVHAAFVDDPNTRWNVEHSQSGCVLCFEGEGGAALESALREGTLRLPFSRLSRANGSVRLRLPLGSTLNS